MTELLDRNYAVEQAKVRDAALQSLAEQFITRFGRKRGLTLLQLALGGTAKVAQTPDGRVVLNDASLRSTRPATQAGRRGRTAAALAAS